MECDACGLLFKSNVPEREAFSHIMAAAATQVWKQKHGVHPALAMMEPYLCKRGFDVLDLGASNGDLLAQLKPRAGRVSALDVEAFPLCKEIVNGEYIIGDVDKPLEWSGRPYDLVTAFDVFEHFFDAKYAVNNAVSMTAPGGLLMIETGDWTTMSRRLESWYYCNLFEHHIFWSRKTFDFLCSLYMLDNVSYSLVNHKGRRTMGAMKRMALRVMTSLAPVRPFASLMILLTGRDPSLFGAPTLRDHAFAVLRRPA